MRLRGCQRADALRHPFRLHQLGLRQGGVMSVAVVTDSTASLPEEMYARYQIIHGALLCALWGPRRPRHGGHQARRVQRLSAVFAAHGGTTQDGQPRPWRLSGRLYMPQRNRPARSSRLHISSIGSGAYQSALIARDMALQRLHGVRIEVVDTRNVSMCRGLDDAAGGSGRVAGRHWMICSPWCDGSCRSRA